VVICLERGADLHMAQLMRHSHSLSLASVKSRLVFTARCYASAVLDMGLCPSVCYKSEFTKTAKRGITQTTQHDSPGILTPKISAKFDRGHPYTRAPNAGGVGQNRRLSSFDK